MNTVRYGDYLQPVCMSASKSEGAMEVIRDETRDRSLAFQMDKSFQW